MISFFSNFINSNKGYKTITRSIKVVFSINNFKSQLVGGGARPSLFQIQITNPITGISDFKLPFMAKAASIPESTTNSYAVPYFGRLIKYGGDRTFNAWQVTIINDEDFVIRNSLEAWSNAINSHVSNTRAYPAQYKSDAIITQYAKDGSVLRIYNFEGLFPTNISEIQMAWSAMDEIEEFAVTFEYDLWTIQGGSTGNPIT
jgi:hypothetical protein